MAGEGEKILDSERQKLWNERRKVFLDEWKVNVEPVDKEKSAALQASIVYAQMAMRNVFLLNGGALVAVPTFAQLLKQPISESIAIFLLAIISYVVGLALITIVALIAFKNFQMHKQFQEYLYGTRATNLNLAFEGLKPLNDAEDQNYPPRVELEKSIDRTAKWGTWLGVAAGACFLIGTVFAMLLLAGVKG